MKKYFLGILLMIFIVPSVAFASWWNPFTWNIFHWFDKTQKTEIVQIEAVPEIASTTPESTATTTATTTNDTTIKEEKMVIEKAKSVSSQTNCQSGYTWDEQTSNCVLKPVIVTPAVPSVADSNKKYIDPTTGEYFKTPQEFADYVFAKCASQNKVPDRTNATNNDGTVNCITYLQSCQNEFGSNGIYSGSKDSEGLLICGCKNGYVIGSDGKSCQKQQQNYDPYNVLSGSENAYSPEQLNAIDCAYYGTNCNTSAPVQINNYYQYTPPTTQTQTVSCLNYQTEKNNLDEYYASNGTAFSGARVTAENNLKAKYPGCF